MGPVLTIMGLLSVLVTLSAAAFSVDHVQAELQVSEVQVSWLTNASMEEVSEISIQQPEINLLYLDSTTVVELPSFTPLTSCPVESHPVPVIWAVTGVLNTGLLVCGGYDADARAFQSACYSLTGGSLKEEPSMLDKRGAAASSIWPGRGLLVTGGGNDNYPLSSTEYLSASDQWTSGPVLPVGMLSHCQVTAGPDVIITGGWNGNSLAGAYKLSTDDSWATLPSMTTARHGHACVVHQDYLVVIGGWGAAATTVEKIKLSSLTEWEAGPGLDTGF